jgi:hypothetical protein
MRQLHKMILGCALLASCNAAAPSGGFPGVTSAETMSFTSTADGCTYSFLFDTFVLSRPAPAPSAPAPEPVAQTRSATLNTPVHVAGANVSIDVRGSIIAADGASGQLEIAFAGGSQTFELSAPSDAETSPDFVHTFSAPATAGASTMRITATLASEPATEAAIHIDSADLVIDGAAFCSGDAN